MSISSLACSTIEAFRLVVVLNSVSLVLNDSQSALCKHHLGVRTVTGGVHTVWMVSRMG